VAEHLPDERSPNVAGARAPGDPGDHLRYWQICLDVGLPVRCSSDHLRLGRLRANLRVGSSFLLRRSPSSGNAVHEMFVSPRSAGRFRASRVRRVPISAWTAAARNLALGRSGQGINLEGWVFRGPLRVCCHLSYSQSSEHDMVEASGKECSALSQDPTAHVKFLSAVLCLGQLSIPLEGETFSPRSDVGLGANRPPSFFCNSRWSWGCPPCGETAEPKPCFVLPVLSF